MEYLGSDGFWRLEFRGFLPTGPPPPPPPPPLRRTRICPRPRTKHTPAAARDPRLHPHRPAAAAPTLARLTFRTTAWPGPAARGPPRPRSPESSLARCRRPVRPPPLRPWFLGASIPPAPARAASPWRGQAEEAPCLSLFCLGLFRGPRVLSRTSARTEPPGWRVRDPPSCPPLGFLLARTHARVCFNSPPLLPFSHAIEVGAISDPRACPHSILPTFSLFLYLHLCPPPPARCARSLSFSLLHPFSPVRSLRSVSAAAAAAGRNRIAMVAYKPP
jgi:hypothetical protein